MSSPTAASPPWRLAIPAGGTPDTVAGVRSSINAAGQYWLEQSGMEWSVEPVGEPPPFMSELDWRLTSLGVAGDMDAIRAHAITWPQLGAGEQAPADVGLDALERDIKPASATELAMAFKNVNDVLLLAPPHDLARYVDRLGRVMLRWYPTGQLVAWGRSHGYVQAGRPAHLLAGAKLTGLDAVGDALATGAGGIWFRGESLETSHPGALYCNAFNGIDLPAVAFETPAFTFVFEFGMNISFNPPLDYLSVRHVHSLPVLDYLPRNLNERSTTLLPGISGQEAFRSWFVRRYNALCDLLIRWENFMTMSGELRPVVLQQTNMTVARILNTTAHMLASQERATQLLTFWAVLDLVAGLAGGIERVMGGRFWTEVVVASLARMPSPLDDLFRKYAEELYAELVEQIRDGVTDSRRLTANSVRMPYSSGERSESNSQFFARYMRVRRNTLHSYDLADAVNRAYLSVHDGSLPQRLPEWARMVLFALLANPTEFLGRYRLMPA